MKIENYYALFCDCSQKGFKDALVVGIFPSRKDAKKFFLEKCPAKHLILKCLADVKVKWR